MSDERLAILSTLSCSGWESVFADQRCAGVGKGRFPHPPVRIVPQETRFPWEKLCCGLCHQGLWHRVGDGLGLVVPGPSGAHGDPRRAEVLVGLLRAVESGAFVATEKSSETSNKDHP